MKTTTLTALFLFACLLVASALADSGESERRPGRPGAGGSGPRPGNSGGATGPGGAPQPGGSAPSAPSAEEDDMTTLFNSINGANGIMGTDTFAQLSAATSGHHGLQKLEININIKVVLVKIGDKMHTMAA